MVKVNSRCIEQVFTGVSKNVAGQELISNHHDPLYYWARNAKSSNAEVDYILLKEGGMYPVQVKSGSTGSLKSLHLALETFPACPYGIVLSNREYKELPGQRIRFVPLYYTGTLGWANMDFT